MAVLWPMATAGARPCGGLRVADVEVVVHEHRATDRRDQDRAVLDAELVDGFGQVLLRQAVPAPGAVGRRVGVDPLTVGVAFEMRVEDRGRHQRHLLQAQHVLDDLALRGKDPAHAADVAHRRRRVDAGMAQGQPQLVFQLAAARLDHDEVLRPGRARPREASMGKGQSVMGRKRPDLQPLVAQLLDGALGQLRRACCTPRGGSRRRRSGRGRRAAQRP